MNTPTEGSLRNVLATLATLLHHLTQELETAPLQAAKYSQQNARKTKSQPTPPLNLGVYQLLHEESSPILQGWACNLAEEDQLPGLPFGKPLAFWCAWLARYRQKILEKPWAGDCYQELTALCDRIQSSAGETTAPIHLPTYATAKEIAAAFHITESAVHKYAKKHQVTAYIEKGKTYYNTHQYQQT